MSMPHASNGPSVRGGQGERAAGFGLLLLTTYPHTRGFTDSQGCFIFAMKMRSILIFKHRKREPYGTDIPTQTRGIGIPDTPDRQKTDFYDRSHARRTGNHCPPQRGRIPAAYHQSREAHSHQVTPRPQPAMEPPPSGSQRGTCSTAESWAQGVLGCALILDIIANKFLRLPTVHSKVV
jgi:hypothetical protein